MNVENDKETIVEQRKSSFTAYPISIQLLPQVVLEVIMSHLSYSEICRLGTLCRAFRLAGISLQYSAVRSLVPQILKQINELQMSATSNNLSLEEYRHNAFLQTVLLILLGEARMFSTIYLRCFQNTPYANIYAGGYMLDELYNVIKMVRNKEINRELEPETSTQLLIKAEHFYEIFQSVVEPTLVQLHSIVLLPFGIKVMDTLNCSLTSDYRVTVIHNSGNAPFLISGYYELSDFNTLEMPPELAEGISNEDKLLVVLHYLRSMIRWNNIFHTLNSLWKLDDLAAKSHVPEGDVVQAMLDYSNHCKAITSQLLPSDLVVTDSSDGIQQDSTDTGLCRQEFVREIGNILGHSAKYGLTSSIQMNVTTPMHLPMDYEFLTELLTKRQSASSKSILEEKFHRIKYPSLASNLTLASTNRSMLSSGGSSNISLIGKDTLSRFSEILSNSLRKLNIKSKRFLIASKSSNNVKAEVYKPTVAATGKSDGWIHSSLPKADASEELNKFTSESATLEMFESNSEEFESGETALAGTESISVLLNHLKLSNETNLSNISSATSLKETKAISSTDGWIHSSLPKADASEELNTFISESATLEIFESNSEEHETEETTLDGTESMSVSMNHLDPSNEPTLSNISSAASLKETKAIPSSDGWIHSSLPKANTSEEINKLTSESATLEMFESNSQELETGETTLAGMESSSVALSHLKSSNEPKLSNISSATSLKEAKAIPSTENPVRFGILDFQMEMRIWRPLISNSSLSREAVIFIRQSSNDVMDFSQHEITTNHN